MPSRAPSPSLARSPGLCLPTRHEPRYRCSRSRPAPDRHTGSAPTRRPCRRGPSLGGTGPVRLVMPGGVAHPQPLFGLMLQRRPIRARRIPRRPAAPTCSADLPRRHDDRRTRRHGGWGRARRAVARRRPHAGLSPPWAGHQHHVAFSGDEPVGSGRGGERRPTRCGAPVRKGLRSRTLPGPYILDAPSTAGPMTAP